MHADTNIGFRSFAARCSMSMGLLAIFTSAILPPSDGASVSPEKPKILVCAQLMSGAVASFPQYNAQHLHAIGQGVIDPKNQGAFTAPQALESEISYWTQPDFDGYLVLNVEGQAMHQLLTQPINSPQFASAVQMYVDVLEFVKAMRPHAKVGFYAIPLSLYNNSGEAWLARNLALAPIAEASDVLYPSVYDVLAPGQSNSASETAYVHGNVKLALQLGNAVGGRPVFPFFCHRYHDSNQTYGMQLIPEQEFKDHIAVAFTAIDQGQRAAGVVWWSSDSHLRWFSLQNFQPGQAGYASMLQLQALFAGEIRQGQTDEQYFTPMQEDRLRWVHEVLQEAPH